jgi:ribonucleotide monophosphatase NagD (HAD superfamily)
MLCANPDIIVAIGEEIVYCAGALAQRYALLGGKVLMFGKPHPPIYAAAFERLRRLKGRAIDPKDVLAIGDGGATDLAGAGQAGIDCLFITEGVHADEIITPDAEINPTGLARLIESAGAKPFAVAREVFW